MVSLLPLPIPICCREDAIIECTSLSWQLNVITSPSMEEGPGLGKSPLIQLCIEMKKNGKQVLLQTIDWEVWNHPEWFLQSSLL